MMEKCAPTGQTACRTSKNQRREKIPATVRIGAKVLKIDLSKYEALYDTFDAGHDRRHLESVRTFAVELAVKYAPDMVDLAYIAATLHDIGLSKGREGHEKHAEEMILADEYLRNRLSKPAIDAIAEAVREHRASTGNPQSVLAKIISDADKGSSVDSSVEIQRAIGYGKKHFPNLTDEEHLNRAVSHLSEKFAYDGPGRRAYFPETRKRIANIFDPIIDDVKKNNLNGESKA